MLTEFPNTTCVIQTQMQAQESGSRPQFRMVIEETQSGFSWTVQRKVGAFAYGEWMETGYFGSGTSYSFARESAERAMKTLGLKIDV